MPIFLGLVTQGLHPAGVAIDVAPAVFPLNGKMKGAEMTILAKLVSKELIKKLESGPLPDAELTRIWGQIKSELDDGARLVLVHPKFPPLVDPMPSTFGNDKPLSDKRRDKLLEQIGLPDLPDSLLRAIEDVQLTGLCKIDPDEEDSRVHCNELYHFGRFRGDGAKIAGSIYRQACILAAESGVFNLSAQELAPFLNVNSNYVYPAIHLLETAGWFEKIEAEPGKPVKYHPVYHLEWAQRHPGFCTKKIELPYSAGDALGRQLYGIMGEEFFPNVLKGFRKTGLSDEAICDHAKVFMQDDRNKGSGKERRKRFGAYLKLQKSE
jgi:hypothetical protein